MKKGLGWRPDLPDIRDYNSETAAIQPLLKKVLGKKAATAAVDLRQYCSPIEDQGELGSCTAHAAAGLYEYFEKRTTGKVIDVSRRFIYKTTRNLMRVKGDTGAELRTAMGALVLFGAPPERYWPYDESAFDQEPPAFLYAYGQNFQALKYFRLDPPGTAAPVVLDRLKRQMAAGVPAMFGFSCYDSLYDSDDGNIPFPGVKERTIGGHAIVCVGYDDAKPCKGTTRKGALLIRNSWGRTWGHGGYGWLPYDYVLKGWAEDFWCMLKAEWVDVDAFSA